MSRIHYTTCPVCSSSSINPLLTVKDHSVSGEEFVLWQCAGCSLRFTQDVPDEDAIAPYYQSADYISHSNTSKGLLNKLYQRVRKITLQQKAAMVEAYAGQRGHLLDVGAGIGAFAALMKDRGWAVTAIEPDEGARKKAQELFNLHMQAPQVFDDLPAGRFNAITLWHVLEHVHSLHPYVAQLKALLSDEGTAFIAVPNFKALDADVYKKFWAAYDVPRHLYHFTPQSMQRLLALHGLTLVAKKPMWFDSFYISLLSSKYYRGHTSWLGAGLTGLRSNLTAMADADRCSSLIYVVKKAKA